MKERIQKLLAVIGDAERLELGILNNGYIAATRENQQSSTKESLKRWRSLRAELVA